MAARRAREKGGVGRVDQQAAMVGGHRQAGAPGEGAGHKRRPGRCGARARGKNGRNAAQAFPIASAGSRRTGVRGGIPRGGPGGRRLQRGSGDHAGGRVDGDGVDGIVLHGDVRFGGADAGDGEAGGQGDAAGVIRRVDGERDVGHVIAAHAADEGVELRKIDGNGGHGITSFRLNYSMRHEREASGRAGSE